MAAAKKRPWKCCDKAFCTMSIPPICRCMDELFECPSTCKSCGPSMADAPRIVCQHQYVGDPGSYAGGGIAATRLLVVGNMSKSLRDLI
ncbi:unnamed protein product [Triticum turgidum subsp. durum]|uniref:Bowman-Birk serine protease inhibitors family domain-containing protein n=2 Tax=Triticum TaxID=4564 RepID=A0A9R1Q603_TRITD|nr:unnamed protein product [Triticum aestivum]VAH71391.1 unnamed protein product [Triticum turgidum subsp. durum]